MALGWRASEWLTDRDGMGESAVGFKADIVLLETAGQETQVDLRLSRLLKERVKVQVS